MTCRGGINLFADSVRLGGGEGLVRKDRQTPVAEAGSGVNTSPSPGQNLVKPSKWRTVWRM